MIYNLIKRLLKNIFNFLKRLKVMNEISILLKDHRNMLNKLFRI